MIDEPQKFKYLQARPRASFLVPKHKRPNVLIIHQQKTEQINQGGIGQNTWSLNLFNDKAEKPLDAN